MNDAAIARQITGELMDRELARRDTAGRSLMAAAAAMQYPGAKPSLYGLHACLGDGRRNAARQLIAIGGSGARHQAEAG